MIIARVLEAVATIAAKPTRLDAVINFATLPALSLAKNAFSTDAIMYPKAIAASKVAIPKKGEEIKFTH